MLPPARSAPPQARAARRTLVAVLLAALALALLPAPTAHAAERTVSGGRLDWGIKSSFLTYVTGPIAQGSWELTGGAGTVGAEQFRFHTALGTYDPDSGAVTAGYSGGVRFTGHQKEGGEFEMDLTLSNPTLEISGASGTLRADMRSKDRDTGEISERTQVAMADLDLGGVDLTGGSELSVTSIPAVLTEEGATGFAGFYQPGDPLDPVTFTADSHAPADADADGSEDEESEEGAEEPAEEDEEPASAEGEIVDAAVDWGVRRTYREFVSGDLAEGGWELSDGAEDGGALFRFADGTGAVDADEGAVSAEFSGSLHFTGNEIDLLLSGVTVEVEEGVGTLSADVATEDAEASAQPLVTFEVEEFEEQEGLLLVEEAPAHLTEEGAEVFSLYTEGTEMDPVSLAVALEEDTELPALPDLGSAPEPEEEPAAEPAADEADAAEPAEAASSSSSLPLLATGGIVLLVLAGAGYLVLRRNRAQRTAPPLADKETPQT